MLFRSGFFPQTINGDTLGSSDSEYTFVFPQNTSSSVIRNDVVLDAMAVSAIQIWDRMAFITNWLNGSNPEIYTKTKIMVLKDSLNYQDAEVMLESEDGSQSISLLYQNGYYEFVGKKSNTVRYKVFVDGQDSGQKITLEQDNEIIVHWNTVQIGRASCRERVLR